MSVNERIAALRALMKEKEIQVYVVPTSDYHQSEYVSEYFKEREYLTGFTGSAGTVVVTMEEAGLWTDGRYFIQAEREIAGSEVKLYPMGMEDVPTVREYVERQMEKGCNVGFDGRVLDAKAGAFYRKAADRHNVHICPQETLVHEIWQDRPAFPVSQAFILKECYAGKSTTDKLAEVREDMGKAGASTHVLNDACDIAWLLNLRGNDICHVPVILSYVILKADRCVWYVKSENITEEVAQYLEKHQISVREYDAFYEELADVRDEKVLVDMEKINYRMYNILENAGNELINERNPEELRKAVKNPVEVENTRNAHVKDGVAVTRFMYWLKNTIGKEPITEMDAAAYMDGLRAALPNYVDISFDTIAAYGANAAMMHYEPNEEHNAVLEPKGFLLVDSGGHYLEGSTDITRTFALGPLTDEERLMFTTVVRSNLLLANAKFLYGCDGRNLDVIAREPLWQMGIDYRCGTGHGNGYLLNVHEGPNAFRWRKVAGAPDQPALEEGMITTDEPGVYEEGRYGIRIENELLCKKGIKNQYGQFMEFENITYAPIDLDAIAVEEMTASERKMLNDYHKMVYEVVAPHLTDEEREWLKVYTREV